jgi:putative transposase
MRDELLNETLFTSMVHARATIAAEVDAYDTERPHSSLGYATPAAHTAEFEKQRAGLTPPVALHAHLLNQPGRPLIATG